jgi:hypothetical protein
MCEKCVPLDRALENFRRLQKTVDDRAALALIEIAIDDLESEKAVLHPESPK